ncbi:uncharacterized protein [Brachionichthys hirsutus]|uniref:uncharacterized protein n=1 Tax=Brachionichthys hirsutus TaxID=412623 RepID=UPI003604B2BD
MKVKRTLQEDISSDPSVGGFIRSKEVASNGTRNAGQRLRDTQDVLNAAGETKVVVFQYVDRMSKELSLVHRMQLKANPGMPQGRSGSAGPEGSVSSVKSQCPEVFYQRLVHLPPSLSQLQSLLSQQLLQELESLAPPMKGKTLVSVFWLQTANLWCPLPRPACVLLSQEDLVVLSSDTHDTLAVFHHFDLALIKEVQIGLAGQHVRLTGCTEDTVLAVFTHSKDLTQELCKALLKAAGPGSFSRGAEYPPLLSGDLMALSLDWTSSVPDITLDNGLHFTSRFKRVLADLLHVVHGNMDGPDRPCLADICPLLYTSVKVLSPTRVHQSGVFQFLLTDTHVALLCEDGVSRPVPRDSSLVPSQPQFQGLEVREHSEIRCLLATQKDSWLVVDMTFSARQPTERGAESRRGSVGAPGPGPQCDSWKLAFGCTAEAAALIDHLCT